MEFLRVIMRHIAAKSLPGANVDSVSSLKQQQLEISILKRRYVQVFSSSNQITVFRQSQPSRLYSSSSSSSSATTMRYLVGNTVSVENTTFIIIRAQIGDRKMISESGTVKVEPGPRLSGRALALTMLSARVQASIKGLKDLGSASEEYIPRRRSQL
ncbi:hypothetical protein WN943_015162 [Citrus x changshan-huyou]